MWHKEGGVQGFHLVQSFAPGRAFTGARPPDRAGICRKTAERGFPSRNHDASQYKLYSQSSGVELRFPGGWPEVSQQRKKLYDRNTPDFRCAVPSIWAVGHSNGTGGFRIPPLCAMAGGTGRKAHLENGYPAGFGRGHGSGAYLEAIPNRTKKAGIYLPFRQKIPHADPAGQGTACSIQDLGQELHARIYPTPHPLPQTSLAGQKVQNADLPHPHKSLRTVCKACGRSIFPICIEWAR